MSAKQKHRCPNCNSETSVQALVDSHDRIESTWRKCYTCGWDQRSQRARTHFEKDGCDPPEWHGPTGE
jgi:transcription elongation factor Elf1